MVVYGQLYQHGAVVGLRAWVAAAALLLTVVAAVWFTAAADDGCTACQAEDRSPFAEGETAQELHAAALAHRIADCRQGLLVGEHIPFELPWSDLAPEERVLTCVYDVRDPLFNPNRSFMLRLLRDWDREIVGLRIHVILTGRAIPETLERVRAVVAPDMGLTLDVDEAIYNACQFDGTQPKVGFLLDAEGVVVDRIPFPRELNASVLRARLEAATEMGIPSEPTPFAAVHPDQVVASPWDLIAPEEIHGHVERGQKGLPTLVYTFGPVCGPCELATLATCALAAEYAGRLHVLGLVGELSADALISWGEYAIDYPGRELPDEVPRTDAERDAYVDRITQRAADHVAGLPHPFPFAMDLDDQYSSVLGLWNSTTPGWALFDADGRLVEVLPGASESVNVDGVLVEQTNPTIGELRERIDRVLTDDGGGV